MRRAALAVALATACVASAAQGAVTPQIIDAKADALGQQAGTDIHSVLFAATRTGKTVNGFTVTMTLGAPPVRQPGVLYRVYGTHSVCNRFKMSWATRLLPGEQDQVTMECGLPGVGGDPYTIVNVTPKVVGSSLVWSFKLKMFPKEMRAGTMSGLEAFVTQAEPVFAIINPADTVEQTAFDHAVGDGTFRY